MDDFETWARTTLTGATGDNGLCGEMKQMKERCKEMEDKIGSIDTALSIIKNGLDNKKGNRGLIISMVGIILSNMIGITGLIISVLRAKP